MDSAANRAGAAAAGPPRKRVLRHQSKAAVAVTGPAWAMRQNIPEDGDDEKEPYDQTAGLDCYRRPAAAEATAKAVGNLWSGARPSCNGVYFAATWLASALSLLAHYFIRAAILFVTGYFISVLIIRQLVQLQQILLSSADARGKDALPRGARSTVEKKAAGAGWNILEAEAPETVSSQPVLLAVTLLSHLIHRRFSWDSIPHWCGLGATVVGTAYTLADLVILRRLHQMQRSWSNVLRCVGGFVGVCYAATKLPWSSSSTQASCSLALISACMWFSFDRTTHGLAISLLTTGIGTGFVFYFVATGMYRFVKADFFGVPSWIPCILFSSCICLGLIGRQLQVVPRRWYRHHQQQRTQASAQKKRRRKKRWERRFDHDCGEDARAAFRTKLADGDQDRMSILAAAAD